MRAKFFLAICCAVLVVACSTGQKKKEATDAGGLPDFSNISPTACACDRDCKLADFDCVAACDAPEGVCQNNCHQEWSDCSAACNGCITLYLLCYQACGGRHDCDKECDAGLPQCQAACGWDQDCLAQCDAVDQKCYDVCGGDWNCYRNNCIPKTKACYAQCI
jgi:hypothetical protein